MELQRPRALISQQSTVWTRRQHAVCVRRACKRYGTAKNPYLVLDNLNMTVPKGTIYGLLGASGCGKTTLLSCIVGRRRLNSGEIWVLGGKPGSKGSGVPGPRIGYMPQETALYGEFTIKETMLYFGWVSGMTTKQVEDKIEFLTILLQLPPANRAVKNLSGGQQRRVSLAAALVHDPELLILDEPTVGVDPLLRQSIWDHMVSITKDNGTTVIITTHYIDETRQAGLIGLMRGGKFLAEESPDTLLRKHNCDSLEEVFLKLSILQNRGKRRRSSILFEVTQAATATMPELEGVVNESFDNTSEISGEFGDSVPTVKRPVNAEQAGPLPPEENIVWTWKDYISIYKPHHMKALIWKNTLWMLRNVPIMLFIVGLPVAQIILFCLSIGHDPVGLNVAIVNYEVNSSSTNGCLYESGCKWEKFSCRYIEFLEAKHHIMRYYDTYEDAVSAVQKGQAWGLIQFPARFSESLKERVEYGQSTSNASLDEAEIPIHLDMSNQHIAVMLKRDIIFSFLDLVKEISEDCQINEGIIQNPIRFNHPIYGPVVPNFTDFAAPGVMLTIIFFLAVALTSGAMLIERNEGILERSLVNGITGVEILTAHVITQFVVMLGQSVMVLFVALFVFPITNEGGVLWIVVLFLLNGTCGMCYGFVVSCVTDSERNATYLALGSFLPFVMLCGIIWPVEGMNTVMKTISFFLPLTLSTESLRSILARGWSIYEPTVYYGFVSVIIWIVILLNASIFLIKFKKG